MKVPPDRPLTGTGQLPFQVQAQLQTWNKPLVDNTRVAPIPRVTEQLDLSFVEPTACTEVSFVSGHAPVTLQLTKHQDGLLQDLIKRFPTLRPQLEQLATAPGDKSAPRLLSRDKDGLTLLDQLHRLATSRSKFEAVDTGKVLAELLPRLADRNQVFQGPQFTCGSAALQNYLQREEPGELGRIMADLLLTGKSKLRDGSKIGVPPEFDEYLAKRPGYSFNGDKDKDVRALCDTFFQSAVMQDISLVGGNRAWKGGSDNLLEFSVKKLAWLTDWAGYDPEGDDTGLMSRLKGNGGGDPYLLASLMEATTGKSHQVTTMLEGRGALQRELAQAHAENRELIALYKSPLHYVLVTGYDPVRNTVTCLSTGTYKASSETMSLNDFLNNCGALVGT